MRRTPSSGGHPARRTGPPGGAVAPLVTGQPDPPPPSPPRRLVSRRRLLAGAGAAGAAGLLGAGAALRPQSPSPSPSTVARTGRAGPGIAVLVTLYGGNDGLNTVVPASDPAYAAGRPTLGYRPEEVLPLGDGLGLNPRLTGLARRWGAGQLAIVRGVGYPDPSLSHFQSMAVWQTADAGGVGTGWLGRWLDLTGTDPMRAISIGASLPPALRGSNSAATAITSPDLRLPGDAALLAAYQASSRPGPDRSSLAAAVAASGADLLGVRTTLASLIGPAAHAAGGAAAPGSLSAQLAVVATLIGAGAPTQLYQVSVSSFDTHAGEKADHERLLGELDAGIDSFLTAVGNGPRSHDVVLFTVSEFGRRVAENASGGTDHGTAAPLLVAGHGVKGGFVGDEPSLRALDADGNLHAAIDFRSVYATILEQVLGVDSRRVLASSYPTLDLLG